MADKPQQPLSLQWLVYIRDHGLDLDVTLGERALASILPTYGKGERIFVSMHTLARATGWSRNTVKKHRDGLIKKGLLKDIEPDEKKQSRTYRLAIPSEGGQILTQGDQILTQGGQELTQGGSESDHNINGLDQDSDQAATSPDRDDAAPSGEEPQTPGGDPQTPQDGDVIELDSEDWEWISGMLGVPLSSIGMTFRTWLNDLLREVEISKDDAPAIEDACYRASAANSPVGYLKASLPHAIDQHRARRGEAAEAEQKAASVRAEIELWREKIRAIDPDRFHDDWWEKQLVRMQAKGHVSDEQKLAAIPEFYDRLVRKFEEASQ